MWGNSYAKIFKQDIRFRFTCGELKQYENHVKFQSLMSTNLDPSL